MILSIKARIHKLAVLRYTTSMKIFIAASYSAMVNYDTGEVFPEYRTWLETQLNTLEAAGHTVFCALRQDNYKINNADPAAAYNMDVANIESADALLALVSEKVSAGVQTEIGYALALGKQVVLALDKDTDHLWFNKAIIEAGQATAIILPLQENINISTLSN